MDAVRRPEDHELCGHVAERDGRWRALTVFGADLGHHDRREGAVAQVLQEGLASLAERWTLRDPTTGDEQVVCIQEATTRSVTIALGCYSMAGVPTRTLMAEELAAGRWDLRR